jgi:hypothetical protein
MCLIQVRSELGRGALKLAYLSLKIRNVFVNRRQHLRIFQLRLLDMLDKQRALKLSALQALLQRQLLLFHFAETRQNRAVLVLADVSWFFLHKVCWCCGCTPTI